VREWGRPLKKESGGFGGIIITLREVGGGPEKRVLCQKGCPQWYGKVKLQQGKKNKGCKACPQKVNRCRAQGRPLAIITSGNREEESIASCKRKEVET